VSQRPPPVHMWERLFCGPQCVDVVKCCGEAEPVLRCDAMDDELVSVQYDEGGPCVPELQEKMPFMSQPQAARQAFRSESVIPWADLNGIRRTSNLSHSTSDYGAWPAQHPSLLKPSGTEGGAQKSRLRASSPSINPYSKYGFITVTVRASSYLADSSDMMDVEFARHLLALDRESASALELRRLAHGRYEVQGRRLSVRWGEGDGGTELLCIEEHDELGGEKKEFQEGEVPLGEYLRQMAALAANVKCPADRRLLTFVDDGEAGDRWEAMKLAVEQAKMREQVADACAKNPWMDLPSRGPELRPQLMPTTLSSHSIGRAPLAPLTAPRAF